MCLFHQDNLMESVVLRFLRGASKDSDVYVKFRAAQLLVQLLTRCSPKWSTPVLAIINSILRNGMTVAPKAKGDKVSLEYKFSFGLPFCYCCCVVLVAVLLLLCCCYCCSCCCVVVVLLLLISVSLF